MYARKLLVLFCLACIDCIDAQPIIYINQVAFDKTSPKFAVVQLDKALIDLGTFSILNKRTGKEEFKGTLSSPMVVDDWAKGKFFYEVNFSRFQNEGYYSIEINIDKKVFHSDSFYIEENALPIRTIPSIIHYYNKQRANTPTEMAADENVKLYGSEQTVDLRGGWCDASGDVSKYFSHLAYANYMSPQQIPLVIWSMLNTLETVPKLLDKLDVKDSLIHEAMWGADYLMLSLSKDDYFYMIVFSYFNKDPNARRVVGLKANSVTNADYACAFREGGGMAIAALARASQCKEHGEFTSAQYLAGAERAFTHLLINNRNYDDDGKENIIDDYCALTAATELWIVTNKPLYATEARKRAKSLAGRMSSVGYFIADGAKRPFWHASDAGLPIIALARYISKENNLIGKQNALLTIKRAIDYEITVSNNVGNPFGYPRQHFLYKDSLKEGFFIPHDNETGWWWQGENARLASLATAMLVGGRLVYPSKDVSGTTAAITKFASQQINWILGANPYSMCFMYGFGTNNVPYMASNFGHGSEKGGISNGITGKDGNADGSGIDFKTSANGNEWRWTEQWLPHAAWFLQAMAAVAEPYE